MELKIELRPSRVAARQSIGGGTNEGTRRRTAPLVAVAAALAVLAATASPASAQAPTQATVNDCSMFDSVALLTSGLGSTSARYEDVAREPSLSDTAEEVPASAKGKGGPGFRATVDVSSTSSRTVRPARSPTTPSARRSRS